MDAKELALIKRFAAVVGHELRNPLAVMNNSSYFLKAKLGAGADPKVAKHLDILASEIARADGLISEIVSFARPVEVKPRTIELASAVAVAVSAVNLPPGVKVETKVPKKDFLAQADDALVVDALKRVLLNAVEAVGESGKIAVSGAVEGKEAVLEISDSGPGFAPDALPMAGQPFFSKKPKNLGLGLAKAAQTAERFGGSLTCANGAKGGAVVRMRLPRP